MHYGQRPVASRLYLHHGRLRSPFFREPELNKEKERIVARWVVILLLTFVFFTGKEIKASGGERLKEHDVFKQQNKTAALLEASSSTKMQREPRLLTAKLLPEESIKDKIEHNKIWMVKGEDEFSLNDKASTGKRDTTAARVPINLNLRLSSVEKEVPSRRPFLQFPSRYERAEYIRYRPLTKGAYDFEFSSVHKDAHSSKFKLVGAAFATNVVLHELGHHIIADYVEAKGSKLNFLKSKDGQFFLASSTVKAIDEESRLSYNMGGEWAADKTFEYALNRYRNRPNIYNKALMFFSGTDLFWYTLYSFYLSDGHKALDPIAITTYNNISKEAVLLVALSKTLLNAYRIYSGTDRVVPSFGIDKNSVSVNLRMVF